MILIQNFITFILIIRLTSATLSYCSSQNTGSQLVNSSIYQSNGLCHDKCNQEGFALAIVQYQDCWCSNYVPGNTIDVDECNMNCPGFPSEKCGGDDLYGYIYLNQPSGTVGGSSSTTSSSTSTSPSTSTSTSTTSSSTSTSTTSTSSTSTSSSTSTTSSSTSPSSSFIQPTTSSTSSSTSSSTWSPPTPSTTSASPSSSTSSTSTTSTTSSSTTSSSTSTSSTSSTTTSRSTIPITTSETTSSSSSSAKPISTPVITSVVYSISTVTGGKQTQYVTTGIQTTISISTSQDRSLSSSDSMARATGVTPTADNSGKNNDDNNDDSFFDSKGKVAGVFTAVGVVGVVILSLLLWVLTRCLRNKKYYDDEDVVGVEGFQKPMNNGPKGFVTKTNILHEDEFNEVSSTDDTVINEKQHSNANSMKQKTNGNGNGNNGHKKNLSIVSTDFGTPIIDNHGDSTYVDQRLDVGTFSNIHERDEVLSLNDNEDYSRKVLRVTNP